MTRDPQLIFAELMTVLNMRVYTGQVVLNVHQGRLETIETRAVARLKIRPDLTPPPVVVQTT